MIFLPPPNHIREEMEMQQLKILDNKQQGRVIDELRQGIQPGAKLSVISAFFTIYAYEELKKELSQIDEFLSWWPFWC